MSAGSSDAVLAALVRLLDDLDTGVPMLRALLRARVLRPDTVADGKAAAELATSKVCLGLLTVSITVSCHDKKGSRYGQHALEQAMALLCAACTPEAVAHLQAVRLSGETLAHFRNSCLAFCRALVEAPLDSCPGVLRTVLCHVREQLSMLGASAEEQRKVLYSVYALSYLCPVLRDPAAYGISGFPQPLTPQGRELLALLAAGLETDLGCRDKRSSKPLLSGDARPVIDEVRKVLGEFCLGVLAETRDAGAPSSGSSFSSMQPMSGQSFVSVYSAEEPVMSNEVFQDLENVSEFASGSIDVIKERLERQGYQSLALAFEEELNRKELALRVEEMANLRQATKKKVDLRSGRVCTLPGLARIKGGKGRLFGLKYREVRSDEGSEPSDEDLPIESHLPSMAPRVALEAAEAAAVKTDEDCTGVGLQFEQDAQGYLRVKKLAAGGPAERCGMIDVHDVLIDVSGQNIYVHDNPLKVVKGMVLGKMGTVIEFGLQKPGTGQVKRVKLRRAQRYGTEAKSDPDAGPASAVQAATSDPSVRVRPRVKVRTAFTKGQSEHNRASGEPIPGASGRPNGYGSVPGGPRLDPDVVTSTASVGSEKFEISGVGVTLKMGEDGMCYVHDILEGGPAERNGCLSHGDRMLAINDISLEGKRFDDCARILNGSMGTGAHLDLISVGDFGSSEPQVKRISLRRTWVPDVVWNAGGDDSAPRLDETGDTGSALKQANVLHGVGITFTKTQSDSTFSVKRVTEGGPADVAGTIRSGDIIKTVDGVSVERKSYRQFARMILGPLGSIVQLGIERGPEREQHLIQLERGPAASNVVSEQSSDSISSGDGADEPPARRSTLPETTVASHASRTAPPPAQMVGVGLKCDKNDDGRFVIAGVQPGGPAARSNRIFVGDQLRGVGGVDLAGKSKTDLRDMIMGLAGTSVTIHISHADGTADKVVLVRDAAATASKVASDPSATASAGNSGRGELGMQLKRVEGGLLQVDAIQAAGGTFQSQRVEVGDVITDIDGVRVLHLDDQTVADLLCGVPGTVVKLALRRPDGSVYSCDVVRTPSREAGTDGAGNLDEEKSFDVGSDYGGDDSESGRGSRSRKTGLGMSFKSDSFGRIVVRRVKEGGPAARLGIREGDTIVALDDQQLQNMYSDKKELSRLMLGYPGSRVTVEFQRKGQTKVETTVLTRGRDGDDTVGSATSLIAPQDSWMSDQSVGSGNKAGLGLTFVKPDGQPGVLVKRVKQGGAAAATGKLFPGDRVMQIDGQDLLQVTSRVLTSLVMGPEGSVSRLKVIRPDGSLDDVAVLRGDVAVDPDSSSVHSDLRPEPSIDFSVCGESRRERCGLGITFRPLDGLPGMVINRIKSNGPAVGTGIEPGDRLLAVDGVSLESRSSSELSDILLGKEGSEARLHIQKAGGGTCDVMVTRSPGLHSENSRESVTSSVDSEAASDISQDQDELVGIGLTFYRPDGQGGVKIKRVKEGSAAAADGRIAAGDRLLAIDGQALGTTVSHQELTRRVLGNPGSLVTLAVRHGSGKTGEVTLQRHDHHRAGEPGAASGQAPISGGGSAQLCGLGVTFYPPNEGDGRVVIKRVKEGGAAECSGRIMAGDLLVEIEGKPVQQLSGSDLRSLLMGLPGTRCSVRVQHPSGACENVDLVRAAKDEPAARPAGRARGIASEMSMDEVAFAAAASSGERRRKVGLGMVLHEHDGGEGLAIRKVKAGSASALSGKVAAGDRLLSIDGTSLQVNP
jgi:C-terminal processing protease CtpA/Prc